MYLTNADGRRGLQLVIDIPFYIQTNSSSCTILIKITSINTKKPQRLCKTDIPLTKALRLPVDALVPHYPGMSIHRSVSDAPCTGLEPTVRNNWTAFHELAAL
ncbi:jg12231 [Pararge aegeria aegeria]|uniref:Jg12231 protein n=1 Tax=Pararge aegeria aegeria TaxID=348720 RepID=A0A8S4S6W9_9NEOP|nr:jg12231 [Pararge aegeria aegeria]